jgi:hypothetical protein
MLQQEVALSQLTGSLEVGYGFEFGRTGEASQMTGLHGTKVEKRLKKIWALLSRNKQ